MPAVGCFRNKRAGLYGFEPISGKALADLIGAYMYVLMAKLGNDPSGAITALMLVKNGSYLLIHNLVFDFKLMGAFIAPFIKTTAIDLQHFAYLLDRELTPYGIDKCIDNCQIPRLKIPKAFFKMSRSCSVRRSSDLKRSFSSKELLSSVDNCVPFLPA